MTFKPCKVQCVLLLGEHALCLRSPLVPKSDLGKLSTGQLKPKINSKIRCVLLWYHQGNVKSPGAQLIHISTTMYTDTTGYPTVCHLVTVSNES
jgi:hypothetical protein